MSALDISTHLPSQFLGLLHVLVLDLILLGIVNKVLQFLNMLLLALLNSVIIEPLSFPQVPFGDQTGCELVDLILEAWVKLDV